MRYGRCHAYIIWIFYVSNATGTTGTIYRTFAMLYYGQKCWRGHVPKRLIAAYIHCVETNEMLCYNVGFTEQLLQKSFNFAHIH